MFYYGYMFSNPYYMLGMVLVLIGSIAMMMAQFKVSSAYGKYKKIPNSRGKTGQEVAREILDSEGLYHVEIKQVNGQLSDHYNPSTQTIALSNEVYSGTSLAALSVAAHECGHAIQYKEGYAPIKLRNGLLPIVNMGQYLGWIAIMIGLFMNTNIAWFGFILMCGLLLFQLVTLPVEFNASSRALNILESRYLYGDELVGAKRMLSAAALTYVASLFATLMSMLRIFLMILASSGRRD